MNDEFVSVYENGEVCGGFVRSCAHVWYGVYVSEIGMHVNVCIVLVCVCIILLECRYGCVVVVGIGVDSWGVWVWCMEEVYSNTRFCYIDLINFCCSRLKQHT